MILTAGILLLGIKGVLCEECVIDNNSRDLNEERKLDRDLLMNYVPFEPPQNTTTVKVRFLLKYFTFVNDEEIFVIYNWLFFKWVDHRLQWNPKDYGGINETQFETDRIWTPELKHRNKVVYYDLGRLLVSGCLVTSSGQVTCILQVVSETLCKSNITNWPYDTQSCSFNFGVKNDYKSNTIITFNSSRGISMFGAEYGPGWNIIDFEKGENRTCGSQIYFTFIVERQGESLESLIIIPSFVLSVLTVSSLFLDVDRTREGIALLSLLGHFYIKTFINVHIPKPRSITPSILRLCVTSFVFTAINFILTFVLSYLRRKKVEPNTWVVFVNDFVFKSPLKFVISPKWEATNLTYESDETNRAVETWTGFANIINSCCIIISIIVYVSIFLCLVPKQLPFDYQFF